MASPHPPAPRPPFGFGFSQPATATPASVHFYQPTAAGFGFGGPAAAAGAGQGRSHLEQSGQGSPFFDGWGADAHTPTQSPGAGPSTFATQATPSLSAFSPSLQRHHSQPAGAGSHVGTPTAAPASASRKRRVEEAEHAGPGRRLQRDRDEDDGESADESNDGQGAATHRQSQRADRVTAGRRGGAKRVRADPSLGQADRSGQSKALGPGQDAEADGTNVDMGVLLASIPPSAHLSILTTLLAAQPSLARHVLALVPPLDVQACNDEMSEKSRAVMQAVPLGAGRGPVGAGVGTSSAGMGAAGLFGARKPGMGVFGRGSTTPMSSGYVESRIREPLAAFCSSASTYLACFSSNTAKAHGNPHAAPPHPTTTATFLAHLTSLLVGSILPCLTAGSDGNLGSPAAAGPPPSAPPITAPPALAALLSALLAAWRLWKRQVSAAVNAEGGMFGARVVEGWFRVFDEAARAGPGLGGGAAGSAFVEDLVAIGDELVAEIGWLVGRSHPVKLQAEQQQHHQQQQQQQHPSTLPRLHTFGGFGAAPHSHGGPGPAHGRISPVDQSME